MESYQTIEGQSRRAFIRTALSATVVAAGLQVSPAVASDTSGGTDAPRTRRLLTPQQFNERLQGPIQSHPSPMAADRSVDFEAIHKIIARGQRFGVRIFELTAGNSQYFSLSFEEIRQITQAIVGAVGDDEIVIAAAGDWWTDRVVDYARFSERVGADALQVMLPSLAPDEAAIIEHFGSISNATRLPLVLHGTYSESLLRELLGKFPSIVAMKEDGELAYYIDREMDFGDRLNIFAGGAESRFLVGYPYGAKAFFSTYTSFAPDISMKFWNALKSNDVSSAVEITKKYDHPFIERFSHSFWHATLEYFGVAKRYMRPPQSTYSDEQMIEVKQFFDGQGLNPQTYM
jgi:5-dehydro-4-deoxyglucarate dehydratase